MSICFVLSPVFLLFDNHITQKMLNMAEHLNIPAGELRLGADDNTSTLTTQETSAKHLVYITNMQEGTLETVI